MKVRLKQIYFVVTNEILIVYNNYDNMNLDNCVNGDFHCIKKKIMFQKILVNLYDKLILSNIRDRHRTGYRTLNILRTLKIESIMLTKLFFIVKL